MICMSILEHIIKYTVHRCPAERLRHYVHLVNMYLRFGQLFFPKEDNETNADNDLAEQTNPECSRIEN